MMPCLSIRQPWAWLIVQGFKDIENRDWATQFRGRLLVHAGQTMTRPYYCQVRHELQAAGLCPDELPDFEALREMCGGIVGITSVIDCRQHHPSPWKQEGSYGFVLRESQPLPFHPWLGRLGFFNVPDELAAELLPKAQQPLSITTTEHA